MLPADSGRSQHLASRALAAGCGTRFDLGDQIGDEFPPFVLREVFPARQRGQGEGLKSRELRPVEVLSPAAGGVRLGLVEPVALHGLAGQEGLRAVHSRPIRDSLHESLLDPVREDVFQPLNLGAFFGADHDGLVPPRPDLVAPVDEAPDFARQVGVDVAHEAGELEGIVHIEGEVEMVRDECVRTDADRVLPLGPSQDADDDVVDGRVRAKEETAVEGSAGDLDEGTAFGDEPESSHARIRRKKFWTFEESFLGLSFRGGSEVHFDSFKTVGDLS